MTKIALALAALLLATLPAAAQTFSNPTPITINDLDQATPYPSQITVSGVTGFVTKVTVTVVNWSHTFDQDVGIKVSNPLNTPVLLDGQAGSGVPVTNATVTFSMTSGLPPLSSPIVTGSYLPTAPFTPVFNSPAPAGNGTNLNVYNFVNPNGTWNLWVQDFGQLDTGTIAGGWSITFTTVPIPEPTTWLMLGLGVGAWPAYRTWKRRRAKSNAALDAEPAEEAECEEEPDNALAGAADQE